MKPDSINTGNREARNQRRKEKQKANKRKSFQEQEEQGQSRGYSSSAASSTWRPRYIDECRLLSTEDSTAERRFHCIVLQLAADFIFHSCT